MKRTFAVMFACLFVLAVPACTNEEPPHMVHGTKPPRAPVPRPNAPCDFDAEELDLELPVWDLIVDEADWDALLEDPEADVEVDASLCVDGERYPIELELQGVTSRKLPKKSFDLKLNQGKRLRGWPYEGPKEDAEDGIGKIILKAMFEDHSLIREALAFDLFRAMGGRAPRNGYANLRINGAYWGLYVLVEPIDEDYLVRQGYPTHGTLYKATRKHGSFADFKPGRDLDRAFEHKTLKDWADDEDEHDRRDIERLVRTLQETELTDDAYATEIDPIFPLEAYFERLIWVSWTQNGDGTAQNYYLYNAPQNDDDHWHQLPWDSNICFSADWRDPDRVRAPHAGPLVDGNNYFGKRLVRVPGVRERYITRFREVLDEVLTPDVVFDRFEHHSRLVEHDLAIDQERWRRNVDPSSAFDVLVDFFEARPDVLREALAELEAQDDGVLADP